MDHSSSLRFCRYKKLVDAFFACDRFTFPNICVLLHLALAMPIMSCESERSFSQLKLMKTPIVLQLLLLIFAH